MHHGDWKDAGHCVGTHRVGDLIASMYAIAGSQNAAREQQQQLPEIEPQSAHLAQPSSMQTDSERGISNFYDSEPKPVPYHERQHGHIGMSELQAHLPAAVSMTQDSVQ